MKLLLLCPARLAESKGAIEDPQMKLAPVSRGTIQRPIPVKEPDALMHALYPQNHLHNPSLPLVLLPSYSPSFLPSLTLFPLLFPPFSEPPPPEGDWI